MLAEAVSDGGTLKKQNTIRVRFLFIIIPGAAGPMLQLQNVMQAEVMHGKRKNVRKQAIMKIRIPG